MPSMIEMTEELKSKILKMYNDGKSIREIDRTTGVERGVIKRFLKRNGVDIRSAKYYHGTETHRKYHYDRDYFKIIDSEDKAYWLGFIWADGCIMKRGENSYLIQIALKESDIGHLEKFKKCIKSNYEIKTYRNYMEESGAEGVCRIQINSTTMAKDLMRLGVMPNKSVSKFYVDFSKISDDMIRHVARGYYDGNGCYYIKDGKVELSACGNKESIFEISGFLEKFGVTSRVSERHPDRDNNNFTIKNVRKNEVYKFFNLMYLDSYMWLDRKYEIAINFVKSME